MLKHLVPAALAAITAVLAVAACGGTSTVTVHGTVTPHSEVSGMFGGVSSYANCSLDSPAPGTQITVTDPSGKVIGTAALGYWTGQTVAVSGLTLWTCPEPFTMKDVPSEPRYGFHINGAPGTIWETSVNNVALNVTGGSS
jgi:hypothetical protein